MAMMTEEQRRERLSALLAKYPGIDRERQLADYRICREYLAGERGRFEPLFEAAYKRMAAYVRRFAYHSLNEQDIEDIIAESASVAIEKLHQFGGWSRYSTWMKAIARYRVFKCANRKRREALRDDVEDALGNQEALPNVILKLEGTLTARALMDSLPELEAQIMTLRAMNAFTLPEIAQTLRLPVPEVRKIYYRARDRLRRRLSGKKVGKN